MKKPDAVARHQVLITDRKGNVFLGNTAISE